MGKEIWAAYLGQERQLCRSREKRMLLGCWCNLVKKTQYSVWYSQNLLTVVLCDPVYKVTTCLALRRKSHHQVNKICVPEYFCHPVCGVASRFCTAKPELLMSNSFLRSCWLCSRSISGYAANFASMESSGPNTFRSIKQSFFSRFRCRVISKNQYLRWLKWLSPMIKIRRCSSCRGCGSIAEFMYKQICEYYSTIGCFLIKLLVKLTIMRFYDPPSLDSPCREK